MWLAFLLLSATAPLLAARPYLDRTHHSTVFGEERHYRIFLPPGYATSGRRYPVIYYFHGHSDRYTLEAYDHGQDTVPKIARFVASHPVIVVAPDGYLARDYRAFYDGTPYDVRREGGDFDFGAYFAEFVHYIDNSYRTLTTRRYRATSGLSMGGFMSLYLSSRYPDLVGSASAFNPGPEFYVGEKGRRSLWRPKDHVPTHERTMIRLIRASGDYISQYHEETRTAYAIDGAVPFEFRQDEYHRHWATSIAETFSFHLRAFANPALDQHPSSGWNYASAYRDFNANGYRLTADIGEPAILYLSDVTPGGFLVQSRRWAPDGPSAACSQLDVTTPGIYRARTTYRLVDLNLSSREAKQSDIVSDSAGRLHLRTDCGGHQFGINGPGAEPRYIVLLPFTGSDVLRLPPATDLYLPLRIFNPSTHPRKNVEIELKSDYPTIRVLQPKTSVASLAPGAVADLSDRLQLRATAGAGDFAHARLLLQMNRDSQPEPVRNMDVLIQPEDVPPPLEISVLDGRTASFPVFHQAGNQGGGSSVVRTVTEGRGNGNGVLEPGEQATIWVRVKQGLDPFDKGNWRRAKVYGDSPWLAEVADIEEDKQREWTSAQSRTSLVELNPLTPKGTSIPLILDCEGWSFFFTPDVRFGEQPLYQAFQIHNHQLFRWTWNP